MTTASFLLFLRRCHAWVGLTGAAFGILFGVTGFLMSHRSVMKIDGGRVDEVKVQVQLDRVPVSIEELTTTLADQFHLPMARVRTRVLAPRPARFGGQAVTAAPQWQVLVGGHAHFARATYTPGNRTVELERSQVGMVEALKRLHRAEAGQVGFILLADGFAGAVLFLILSGTLIWSRLAGPRLLSAGLALGGLLALVAVASRAW